MAALSMAFRRLLIRQFMPQWFATGQSVTAFYNWAKGTELGMRKQSFLKIGREVAGKMKKETLMRAVPLRAPLKIGHMIESDLRRGRRYRVYGRVQYHDTLTDEIEERVVSFYTDSAPNKQALEDDFLDQIDDVEDYTRYKMGLVQITSIEHQRGAPY